VVSWCCYDVEEAIGVEDHSSDCNFHYTSMTITSMMCAFEGVINYRFVILFVFLKE